MKVLPSPARLVFFFLFSFLGLSSSIWLFLVLLLLLLLLLLLVYCDLSLSPPFFFLFFLLFTLFTILFIRGCCSFAIYRVQKLETLSQPYNLKEHKAKALK